MEAHSSILPWEIPWTEEHGGPTVHGVIKSQTWLSNSAQLNSQHTLNILVSAFICATAFKIPFLCPMSHPPNMAHEGGNPLTVHSDARENWLVYLSCWPSVLHKPTPNGYVGRRLPELGWIRDSNQNCPFRESLVSMWKTEYPCPQMAIVSCLPPELSSAVGCVCGGEAGSPLPNHMVEAKILGLLSVSASREKGKMKR